MQALSILLIEDNQIIAQQLSEFFERQHWNIDYASNGGHGIALALAHNYDLVLLDLTLPDLDGIKVCRRIKSQSDVNLPVLMLTARDAFEDKLEGFRGGADDYVTKPFDFRELALRCQALARRNDLHQKNRIKIQELTIDKNQHIATRTGKELKLTNIGFKVLLVLAQAYPQAVTRSQLMHEVWQDNPPDSDALRSHIYGLRNALDKPFSYPMLVTLTGIGYKLTTQDEGQHQ